MTKMLTQYQIEALKECAYRGDSGCVWKPKTLDKLAARGLVVRREATYTDASGTWAMAYYVITGMGSDLLRQLGQEVKAREPYWKGAL
jgi:hypothetical protein